MIAWIILQIGLLSLKKYIKEIDMVNRNLLNTFYHYLKMN